MKKSFVKRLFAVFLILIMMLQQAAGLHVHAGHVCPECNEWIDDGEYCQHCYRCENCYSTVGYCDICEICLECAIALDDTIHCKGCFEVCFADESVSMCMECWRCADCCGDMVIDEWGGLCRDCFGADPEAVCPECEDRVIRDLDGNDMEDMGECGGHYYQCYEDNHCPECMRCLLCNDLDWCETCELCIECALSQGYHCELCEECIIETEPCKDGGEHCAQCCEENEWLCENCGACTEALGRELCEYCGRCEDCQDGDYHCQECGECYENVDRCADGGEHCIDCCESNEWICSQCGRCMEAYGYDKCEFCGLCSECCTDNSYQMGDGKECVANPKQKEEFEAKHDAGNHILVQKFDNKEHWYICVYPGCTYEEGREKHVPDYNWKSQEGGWGNNKGIESCSCKVCGYEKALQREASGKTAYFEISPASVWAENGKDVKYSYKLVVVQSDGKKVSWDKGSVLAFELRKGETWPENPAVPYNAAYDEWERSPRTAPSSGTGRIYGTRNDVPKKNCVREFRLIFYNGLEGDDAFYCYSKSFKVTWAENHLHTYNFKHGIWLGSPDPSRIKSEGKDPLGRCHWRECECGTWWGLEDCVPFITASTGNCQDNGTTDYMCSVCGQKWTEKNESTGAHVPTGILKDDDHRDANKHYDLCELCGVKLAEYDHNFEVKHTFKTCTTEVRYLQCKDCGIAKAEKVDLKTPNHDFSSPKYVDTVYHTRSCKKCGYVRKEEHKYLTELHGRCECGADPNSAFDVTLKGTFCPHGSAEVVFGSGVDASMYQVGWGIGSHTYGPSTNWTFSENDAGAAYLVKIYGYELNGEYVAPGTDGAYRQQVWSVPLIVFGYMDIPGYPADCVTDGVKAHKMCLGCGKMFDSNGNEISNVSIPKTGHTYDNDCDASCNVCGAMRDAHHEWGTEYHSNTEKHWNKCVKCGADGPAHSHHLIAAEVTVPASCESPGEYKAKCGVCGIEVTNTTPPTGHHLRYFEKTATCITEGWKMHYGCESCGLCYTDDTCTTKVSANEYKIPIDPDNHVGGVMHHNKTHHWIKCKCGTDIGKEEHQFNEDLLCTVCGYQGTKPDYSNLIKWLIIGLLILLLLIFLIIILLRKKKKKKEEEPPTDPDTPVEDRGRAAPGDPEEEGTPQDVPEGDAAPGETGPAPVEIPEENAPAPENMDVLFGGDSEEESEGTGAEETEETTDEAPSEVPEETETLPEEAAGDPAAETEEISEE